MRARKARIFCAKRPFTSKRLKDGSFNRINGIDVTRQPSGSVSRIPRFAHARPDRETAILRHVLQHAPAVPGAEIVAADRSSQNIWGQPYSNQKKIVGFGLLSSETSFIDLTQKQQCAFADQFGRALKDFFAVRSGNPGLIEAANVIDHVRCSGDAPSFCIQPFYVNVYPFGQDYSLGEPSRSGKQPKYEAPLAFILNQFSRWKAAALAAPCRNETKENYMDNFLLWQHRCVKPAFWRTTKGRRSAYLLTKI